MSFTSWYFVFAFALLFIVFRFVRPARGQNAILLVFSWFFYAFGNWKLIFLLWGYSVFAWLIGLAIQRAATQPARRAWLILGLVLALGTLGVFKYLDFGIGIANGATSLLGLHLDWPMRHILLPIGISFYAFQCSAYLIDIYRREFTAERNFFRFALFKAFFPQLVAGPIERAHDLMPQFGRDRRIDWSDIAEGAQYLGTGYLLKVMVADTLDPLVGFALDGAGHPGISGITALLGVGAFGLQIYGDFAGYSLIAVGLARLLGIRLTLNFNGPYLALSPREFWRSWHITLSTWLRDYLYKPLGGNRRGPARTYLNLLLTMTLGGLWHGAAWNFVLWGVFHGAWLAIARAIGWDGAPAGVARRIALGIVTFALAHIGWLLFRVHDLGQVARIVHLIASDFVPDAYTPILARAYFPLLALVLLEQLYARRRAQTKNARLPFSLERAVFIGALAILIVVSFGFSGTPFIYFQF